MSISYIDYRLFDFSLPIDTSSLLYQIRAFKKKNLVWLTNHITLSNSKLSNLKKKVLNLQITALVMKDGNWHLSKMQFQLFTTRTVSNLVLTFLKIHWGLELLPTQFWYSTSLNNKFSPLHDPQPRGDQISNNFNLINFSYKLYTRLTESV
jgi:hypothetical protein